MSSELGSGAGDGTFLRSVAEAGESAVVTSFRSNGCRSKVGPTNVAERLTGKFLKVSTFSIAVAMILVLSLRLVSPRLFECSGAESFSLRQGASMFFGCDSGEAL